MRSASRATPGSWNMEKWSPSTSMTSTPSRANPVQPMAWSRNLPPGSALLDGPEPPAWLGPLDEAGFTYSWRSHDPRLDTLQRQIAALVEQAATTDADAAETFAGIKALTWGLTGETPPPVAKLRHAPPGDPPRLSEAWFC